MNPLSTQKDVAELLNCSLATVSRMVRDQRIPFILLPTTGKKKKEVRFDMDIIERWVRLHSRQPHRTKNQIQNGNSNGNSANAYCATP